MIKEDEIIFKNPKIEELIERSRQEELQCGNAAEFRKQFAEKSMQECGETIIVGYWRSLLEDAMIGRLHIGKWMDFTYETIDRLPYSLISLYMLQDDWGYPHERNATIIGKTIGAVMYGLAMNEHGYALTVEKGRKGPLWADLFNICIEGIQKTDFLAPALQSVHASPIVMQKGLIVDLTPVIRAYQTATGVDLAEHGIANIMLGND